jgi:hypothetical protein
MQYRAIGLLHGKYTPSEEQFTRGEMVTDDGVKVEAVLLGRVMSLVKKHINLEEPHLWVVYPRTRAKAEGLHMQIVGIWEPETLKRDEETGEESAPTEAAASDTVAAADEVAVKTQEAEPSPPEARTEEPAALATDSVIQNGRGQPVLEDGYFSIRGEVVHYAEEEEKLTVKILQSSRKGNKPPKYFQVHLSGKLEGKSVGYFWDLHVKRQGEELVVQDGSLIALVPPKKKKPGQKRHGGKRPPRGGGQFNKPRGNFKSNNGSGREGRGERRSAPPRPVKRSQEPPPTTPE